MKVAIDKNIDISKLPKHEYIYVFDNEPLKELLKKPIRCVNAKYLDYVDINLTDYNIECIKKAKVTDDKWDVIEKKDYKIGIIIPNYNYEHTIEKCLNSIFNQTYSNYEIIFVDDMSTDNSVNIAKKFQDYYTDYVLKIIQLPQKRLNGGARNEGYLHLSSDVDYVWYIDSDDWVEKNALEKINQKLQGEPDVLFVGLSKYANGDIKQVVMPDYKDKYEAIKGWSGSSGKVIKKSLATRQECLYNEGTLKEDRNQHCRICIYMNTFKNLKDAIYVWNSENTKSVTTVRDISWETSTIRHYADTLELYLKEKGKDSKIDGYLSKRVEKTKKEIEKGGNMQW